MLCCVPCCPARWHGRARNRARPELCPSKCFTVHGLFRRVTFVAQPQLLAPTCTNAGNRAASPSLGQIAGSVVPPKPPKLPKPSKPQNPKIENYYTPGPLSKYRKSAKPREHHSQPSQNSKMRSATRLPARTSAAEPPEGDLAGNTKVVCFLMGFDGRASGTAGVWSYDSMT